ncbi:hypothetical protein QWY31_01065 [Cytophagales bacterium LB-30]|uniref:Uncharacterized protein n=1 Tax=Shiella aurantiaca TaxID=3058365 RepID=A0ABT8F1E3_9BACT|nr:hypothetical protein [Shiella aurantiaca]MDN4164066.1 hypothetical protein [Shiella aurantiaca]
MDRVQIVDFYINRIANEKFEIDQVRKDLEANNFEEEEIKIIVRLVDNELQRRLLKKGNDESRIELSGVGVILTSLGAAIMFLSYLGVIDSGHSRIWDMAPLLSGLSILFSRIIIGRTNKFNKRTPFDRS